FIIYKFIRHKIVEHELKNNLKFKQMEKEKNEELHKEKIAMFTSFSHELRTPLTLIINPLEDLIRHNVFSKEIRQTLVLMKRNTERLMLLVNNLMDIQKYNSKRVSLRKETFDIIQFTGDVYKAFENLAKSKEITYEFKNYLPEILPVHYDPIELEKIFFNLLSNAFKYTPRGGEVRMEARLYDREEEIVYKHLKSEKRFLSNRILYFKVEDNGAGIPEKDLNNIFEPFCRLQAEGDESVIGSGIGLSVARSIVEQENGVIWAENKATKGSSFHILLPIEKDLNPEVKSYTLKSYEHDLLKFAFPAGDNTEKSRTLLIVEDNQDVLKYLENNFSSQYYILTASTGIEALQMIEKTKPDLILSDNIMPGMDGIKLCKTIKNNPATSYIPFIIMSAESSLPKIKESYSAGADDYLPKPFEISLLKTRIENLIKTRKNIQKKYEKKIAVDNLNIPVETNDELFLKQYTDIIRNNFSNPALDVDFICQEISMSRANFYRKAKRLTNLSPAEMIKKLRMEVAAQLLRETDLSISEIITKVAFNGNGYFASTFRNMYGVTPKEYRKKFSQKQ
ncbi:MAG: response regulator, partial [Tannerellaceae bacterium]|nr:response regulator [Tannerellaceae bacterium]